MRICRQLHPFGFGQFKKKKKKKKIFYRSLIQDLREKLLDAKGLDSYTHAIGDRAYGKF